VDDSPPLDARAEAAVLDAARRLLGEQRIASGLTLDRVAERAGVDLNGLYRRWPNTNLLLAEAISRAGMIMDIPDVGDTRAELSMALQHVIGRYTERPSAERELLALAWSVNLDDDELAVVREYGERPWRGKILTLLDRAVARGDLAPDADTELVVDLWAGAIAYRRTFRGGTLDAAFVDVLLDMALAGMVPLKGPGPVEPLPADAWPVALSDAIVWLSEVRVGRMVRIADGVPVDVLARAPAHHLQVGGHRMTVTGGAGRDFMPMATEAGTRMSAGVTVEADGGGILPPFLRADRIIVVQGDEAWVAPLEEVPFTRSSRQFGAGARQGPKWDPGSVIDIVVRLVGPTVGTQLVRIPGTRIGHSA
jgi:AcrR family transcriptional regulator